MSDHLPECLKNESAAHICICPELRACEARVEQACHEYEMVAREGQYLAGVAAAREEVAALLPADYEMNWCAAIDAIDALLTEPSFIDFDPDKD